MEILETFFRKDRFYIRVKYREGVKTLPRANHVWLQGNPSFFNIPKGYVVHHLDGDKMNDDISNLAIMQKFHHVAYHWKQKKVTIPAIVERNPYDYCPYTKPKIYKNGPKFRVFVREQDDNGNKTGKWVSHDDRGMFLTKEQAEHFISKIWRDEIPNEIKMCKE